MSSTCADHCRKFALSDSCGPDFQVVCTHQHIESCDQCQTLKAVLDEVEAEIRGSSWNPYNQEHREDLLYHFERARSDIQQWKAHILLSIKRRSQTGRLENGGFKFSIDSYRLGHEIFTVEVSRKAM